MELNAQDLKAGYRWFFGAGLLAVLFSFFLATMDDRLSTSPKEEDTGESLHELRAAQTSLNSMPADSREVAVPSR